MRATPGDWSDPFLAQARDVLRAAWALGPNTSPSTFCMLLQMVFEKLAKAAYARGGEIVPRTHKVASHLFAVLLRRPAGVNILAIAPNVEAFVMELEAAHPSVAGRMHPPAPQLAYPWPDEVRGAVLYPANGLPLVQRVGVPNDRIALDWLMCAQSIETVLPAILPTSQTA